MSKDKKRDESKAPKKIDVEVEIALLGLLTAIISLIGLLNQGWLGGFLARCLVYLFGSMYFVVLIFNVYLGMYLFFKRKKPTIVLGLNGFAIILLLFFLLVASSIYDGAALSTWFDYFNNNFNEIAVSSFRVDITRISQVGGGLIGYFVYALMVSCLESFVANLVIFVIIFACLYILLKKPSIILYKKSKELIIAWKEKRKSKLDNSVIKAVDSSKKIFEEIEDFNDEEEVIEEPVNLGFEVSEEIEVKRKSNLSFDIFHENIFEEDEENDTSVVVNEIKYVPVNENGEVETPSYTAEELEFYGDEELEFYNEDSEVTEEVGVKETLNPVIEEVEEEKISEPLVSEEVKVDEVEVKSTPVYDENDPYSLLNDSAGNNAQDELKDEVELNCEKINQKLRELNIKASVSDYIIGPCVTRYEIVPELGVRVNSITNIESDLKLALAAIKTRMEAPIPGKSAVGIEVANKKRYPVYLKEVIKPFIEDKSKLLVGIGRDLNNKEVVINIDKMPHLLVAGATGSGKSVCINSMIVSLLLRTTPNEVKMILIDPKKVEMLPYANMPHLLCPVVTDPKKASVALKKVVVEMDRRYDEFANNGARNIEGYNRIKRNNGEPELPNIVVIIDELADLMLVASKEVEESIQRITQLARAAGIYLIVATQRPSVDVITGIIKANIPSRIAFSVSSQVDSKTIIDKGGAEGLLGRGDMLMDISGSGTLNRVQGVYVSDEEIFNVVNYVKRKYSVEYNEAFLNLEEEKVGQVNNNLMVNEDTNSDDKLYEEIKDFVIRTQKASTSLLQRHFTVGYSRAARMIDRLEEEGVIGESNGAKPREVLMTYKREEPSDE